MCRWWRAARVPLLGETAFFQPAPFRVTLGLMRPAVLMLGLYRGGNRYELYFEKRFRTRRGRSCETPVAIEEAMRLYAQRLGHYCRQAPYNWFNFYGF
jgi:predicted LPLAT superfamily acyltransferase